MSLDARSGYIVKEEWDHSGAWIGMLEIPAGMRGDILDLISRKGKEGAYLEKEYKEDLKEKEAVALGIAALKVALEEEGGYFRLSMRGRQSRKEPRWWPVRLLPC